MDKLDIYRKQIDKIDLQIIGLLKKRFNIVKNKILQYKQKSGLLSHQPKRYKQIIESLSKQSDKLVSKKFIKSLWELIHQHSLKIQKKI